MDPSELDDETVEQFLNSKLFQKYVAYRNLTDGIQALKEDEGPLYENFVEGVNRRVGGRLKRQSVESVIDAIIEEVEDNTEFLESADDEDGIDAPPMGMDGEDGDGE